MENTKLKNKILIITHIVNNPNQTKACISKACGLSRRFVRGVLSEFTSYLTTQRAPGGSTRGYNIGYSIASDKYTELITKLDNTPELEAIEESVLGLATEVWEDLGSGHNEAIYQKAMEVALSRSGIRYTAQLEVPIYYQGAAVGHGVADLVIKDKLIVELKAQPKSGESEKNQVRKYLRELGYSRGLLINFPQATKASEAQSDIEFYVIEEE